MLRTILENQRVILEALRDGTDTGWITSEIDKRIEATSEELSKLHQHTVSDAVCDHFVNGKKIYGGYCSKCNRKVV